MGDERAPTRGNPLFVARFSQSRVGGARRDALALLSGVGPFTATAFDTLRLHKQKGPRRLAPGPNRILRL
jgi:hypothetical protein